VVTSLGMLFESPTFSPQRTAKVTLYLIKVEVVDATLIRNCSAKLETIEKDDRIIHSDAGVRLTFAPAESQDTEAKTIHANKAEYIDFMAISSDNKAILMSKNFELPSNISENDYNALGIYIYTVIVISTNAPLKRIKIRVIRNASTSTFEQVATNDLTQSERRSGGREWRQAVTKNVTDETAT